MSLYQELCKHLDKLSSQPLCCGQMLMTTTKHVLLCSSLGKKRQTTLLNAAAQNLNNACGMQYGVVYLSLHCDRDTVIPDRPPRPTVRHHVKQLSNNFVRISCGFPGKTAGLQGVVVPRMLDIRGGFRVRSRPLVASHDSLTHGSGRAPKCGSAEHRHVSSHHIFSGTKKRRESCTCLQDLLSSLYNVL